MNFNRYTKIETVYGDIVDAIFGSHIKHRLIKHVCTSVVYLIRTLGIYRVSGDISMPFIDLCCRTGILIGIRDF